MDQVAEFFRKLFMAEAWPPRWHCGEWTEFHGWLYIISDLSIWLAYFGIPIFILAFLHKKKDIPLPKVFWLFGAFILLCGLTHLMDAIIFWWPAYRLSAFIRFLTGVVSIATVIALFRYFPQALQLKTSAEFNHELKQRVIAEKKLQKTQLSLRTKNKELQDKNEEIQQIASMVSHDLKEPLQSFNSILGLMKKEKSAQSGDMAQYIDYLEESSERMRSLITDLLDYARLGTKRELSVFGMAEVIESVKDDLRFIIEEKKAIIHYENLPVIKAYRTEMRMLFQNLINNGLKFHRKDVIPQVSISATERNEDWLFKVEDNGKGISTSDQKKIFYIFERLQSDEDKEGAGIGLAHSKRIVELHNGRIWVESEPGAGSRFNFTISKKLE